MLDLQSPRGLSQLFSTSARLYARNFGQFMLLAGLLVVPFQIAVLLVIGSGDTASLSAHQERELVLSGLIDFVLVIPLVSALLVHAVSLLAAGEQPRPSEILRRAGRVLPTVVAASSITAIGVVAGLVLLFIPGIWLLLRLYVVAQTAAIEGTDWPTTLRRSFALTRGSSWRILGMLVILGLINLTLDDLASSLASSGSDVLQDIVAVAVTLVSQSFSALLGALLYFDLRARRASVS